MKLVLDIPAVYRRLDAVRPYQVRVVGHDRGEFCRVVLLEPMPLRQGVIAAGRRIRALQADVHVLRDDLVGRDARPDAAAVPRHG